MDTLPNPREDKQEARFATLEAFVALGRAIAILPLEHPAVQELEEARLAVDVALTELREG